MGIFIDVHKKLGNFTLNIRFASEAKRIGILGASGCGKSMTLKSIAGIISPDAGTIRIGEQIVFDSGKKINVKPQNRRAGYLFQNYALFPNMTVEQNIAAGLSGSREEKRKRVREMVGKFQLDGLERRLPGELSYLFLTYDRNHLYHLDNHKITSHLLPAKHTNHYLAF